MENLNIAYKNMQDKYGSKNLDSVFGGGNKNPNIVLVFMNPTKRNIATDKNFKGIKRQWLGTKQIWNYLVECGLFSKELNNEIQNKKPSEWTIEFCEYVYKEVEKNSLWITNLAKCTQEDARPLPDKIFLEYKDLLLKEIEILNPKKIILFGNQVSSILLNQKISVSQTRKQKFDLVINNKVYNAYPVFYPVGNGFFNKDKSVEDVKYILNLK